MGGLSEQPWPLTCDRGGVGVSQKGKGGEGHLPWRGVQASRSPTPHAPPVAVLCGPQCLPSSLSLSRPLFLVLDTQ